MSSWTSGPMATYSGPWTFSGSLPGAALDDQGNLLISWADDSGMLNLSCARPADTTLTPVALNVGGAQGTTSVAYANSRFYVFWRSASTGQLEFGTVTSSLKDFKSKGFLNGAVSTTGPRVTVDPAGGTIWAAWRGNVGDESLYLSSLTGQSDIWSTPFRQGGPELNSLFAPAIVVLQDPPAAPLLCTVFCGSTGDAQLYSSHLLTLSTEWFQGHQFVRKGHDVVLSTNNQASLAVSPSRGQALLVYQNGRTLFSTTAPLEGFTGAPGQWSDVEEVDAQPLNLQTGVLVTQATASSPTYLLMADGTNNRITSKMYLYQYNWS